MLDAPRGFLRAWYLGVMCWRCPELWPVGLGGVCMGDMLANYIDEVMVWM